MRRERKRIKIVINITSLIDVIFLLLIFFLVTSTFSEQPGLKIELPVASNAEARDIKELILSVSREGALALNQQPVKRQALPGRLKRAARSLDDPTLILKADRRVSYGLIVELMDISRRSGLKKIIALTASETSDPGK